MGGQQGWRRTEEQSTHEEELLLGHKHKKGRKGFYSEIS